MKRIVHLLLASLLLSASLVSCDRDGTEIETVELSVGKPGDGLVITIPAVELYSATTTGERTLHLTLSGYIPEDFRMEAFGHGLDSYLLERTSVTQAVLSLKSPAEGPSCLRLLATNGIDLKMKCISFSGFSATLSDDAVFELEPGGGTVSLDWFTDSPFELDISDGASSWITADGLDLSVAENQGEERNAAATLRLPQTSGGIIYRISQASGAQRQREVQLEEDFLYFQSIGKDRKISQITPMGTHFEKYPAATREQIEWLSTASNEPMDLPAHPEWPYVNYSVTLYPFGHPSPADVNQHGIGDCCFLAVLADFAYIYPGFIEDIITARSDGNFDVKMFDPMGNRLTVSITPRFLTGEGGNIQQVTGRNSKPTWSTVMEKALLKWETVFGVDKLGGIGPGAAAAPFTGNGDGFGFDPGVLSAADLVRAVNAGLYKRHFITGGFKQAGYLVGTAKTVTSHCYSVYYCPTPGTMFTMRNPWGFCEGGTPRGDGCMDIVDDGIIPPIIDIRIMEPGAAAPFALKNLPPYEKPF